MSRPHLSSCDCYYCTLKITPEGTADDIKKAFKALALKWHPDKRTANSDGSHDQFVTIKAAFDELNDPQKRASYDRLFRPHRPPMPIPQPIPVPRAAQRNYDFWPMNQQDFKEYRKWTDTRWPNSSYVYRSDEDEETEQEKQDRLQEEKERRREAEAYAARPRMTEEQARIFSFAAPPPPRRQQTCQSVPTSTQFPTQETLRTQEREHRHESERRPAPNDYNARSQAPMPASQRPRPNVRPNAQNPFTQPPTTKSADKPTAQSGTRDNPVTLESEEEEEEEEEDDDEPSVYPMFMQPPPRRYGAFRQQAYQKPKNSHINDLEGLDF